MISHFFPSQGQLERLAGTVPDWREPQTLFGVSGVVGMALFLSQTENKIDNKGRVSVPAAFRAALTSQAFPGVVLAPSFDLGAIDGCGHDRLEELNRGLDDPQRFNSEDYELASALFAEALALPFDAEGRVMLPEPLVRHAGLEQVALFVGLGRTFQIWNPTRYAAYRTELLQRAKGRGIDLRRLRPGLPKEGQ
jgi:MraZ protein